MVIDYSSNNQLTGKRLQECSQFYIKGGIQAKGILKQDPEANIWAQEG